MKKFALVIVMLSLLFGSFLCGAFLMFDTDPKPGVQNSIKTVLPTEAPISTPASTLTEIQNPTMTETEYMESYMKIMDYEIAYMSEIGTMFTMIGENESLISNDTWLTSLDEARLNMLSNHEDFYEMVPPPLYVSVHEKTVAAFGMYELGVNPMMVAVNDIDMNAVDEAIDYFDMGNMKIVAAIEEFGKLQ